MKTMNITQMTAVCGLSLAATLAMHGCTETEPATGQAPQSQADDHTDHTGHDHGDMDMESDREPELYTGIRGEIRKIPLEADPNSNLEIRHEQIPEFKNKDGEISVNSKGVAGMASMTMPFPLDEGVSIEGFEIGDKVEFDFLVNWGGTGPAWKVTRIEKIDPTEQLDFTNNIEDGYGDDADAGTDGP